VITISKLLRTSDSLPSGSFNGVSIAIVMVDMKIMERIKPSKYHLLTSSARSSLNLFYGPNMHNDVPLRFILESWASKGALLTCSKMLPFFFFFFDVLLSFNKSY
jgi:hypothetical protein